MAFLRKLWNQISQQWKNIFLQKFSNNVLKLPQWNTFFISNKFLDTLYETHSLNVENYQIHELSGLIMTPNLKVLNLNKNHLTSLENIQNVSSLTHLTVSKNSLKDIYPLFKLSKLEILDISFNNIAYLFPLFRSPIKELYVSHNKIQILEGFSTQKLEILDASFNKIHELDLTNWEKIPREIWLSNNQIQKIYGFPTRINAPLELLDLSYNPITKKDIPNEMTQELIIEGIL